MNIEELEKLIEEIDVDEYGSGYIDCSTATDYMDESLYKRIVAAVKQNIELQQRNTELTKKLEEVEKQGMESLLKIETLEKEKEDNKQEFLGFMSELCDYLSKAKNKEFPIRIGDYKFEVLGKDLLVYNYDPIKKPEPIKLEVIITENSGQNNTCPICKKEIGKYPAISRKDNKTEICSNCGTLEALKAWQESLKDGKEDL